MALTTRQKVPKYKLSEVAHLEGLLKESTVIGLVDFTGIASPQIQSMRKGLEGSAVMKVVKNRFLTRALRAVFNEEPAVEDLVGELKGETAVIATNMNPFKLYKIIAGTKTKSPARGGETAPDDITVDEGPTEFPPGPIVGELQKVGIPAGIVDGKVVIKKAKTLVKAGDTISRDLAPMLTRLGIEPLIVGLSLKAVYENGTIYREDVLAIDEVKFMGDILGAARGAFNVAMFVSYATKFTIKPLISKAHIEALNLAMEAGVVNKETVKNLIAKASMQATVLKAIASGEPLPTAAPPSGDGGPSGGEKKEERKDEEEEKVSEEEAASGLGALFG